MAFNVSYIFSARDQFSGVARKIKKQTKGLSQQFKGLRTQLSRTNRAFKKTSSSMSSGFRRMAAAAIGFFGAREFIRAGSKFQDSLIDLSILTGLVGNDLNDLGNKARQMAKDHVISASEVNNAMKLVGSARPELLKNAKALAEVTTQSLILSNAGGITLVESTEALMNTMGQYKIRTQDAAAVTNTFAAGAQLGGAGIQSLTTSLLNSAAGAALTKVKMEETVGILGVIATEGFKAQRAGTALNAVLLGLATAPIDKLKPQLVGVFAALKNLKALNLTEAQLETFFGREGLAIIPSILSNLPKIEALTSSVRKLQKPIKGLSVAQEQANKRVASFSKKLQKLGIVITDKLIAVFEKLAPTFVKITKDISDFIDSITPKQVEAFANGLRDFTLASVEVVKQLSTQLIPMVKDLFVTIKTANASSFVSDLLTIAEAIRIVLIPVKILAALFKGLFVSFEKLSFLLTGDFKKAFDTSFFDAVSIGGKFLGVFDREKTPTVLPTPATAPTVAPTTMNSQAQIDINIKDREGVVESVKTKRNGNTGNMDLGVNMQSAA